MEQPRPIYNPAKTIRKLNVMNNVNHHGRRYMTGGYMKKYNPFKDIKIAAIIGAANLVYILNFTPPKITPLFLNSCPRSVSAKP